MGSAKRSLNSVSYTHLLGLTLQDIFLIPLMILLYGVFVALMAGALVSTSIGVYLNLALKNLSFIPQLIIPLNFL